MEIDAILRNFTCRITILSEEIAFFCQSFPKENKDKFLS